VHEDDRRALGGRYVHGAAGGKQGGGQGSGDQMAASVHGISFGFPMKNARKRNAGGRNALSKK
jgi:hypothetical protein